MSLRWQAQVFLYLMEVFEASSCSRLAPPQQLLRVFQQRAPTHARWFPAKGANARTLAPTAIMPPLSFLFLPMMFAFSAEDVL